MFPRPGMGSWGKKLVESTSLLKHQPLGSSCLVSTSISFGEHSGICVLDGLPPQTGRSHTGCWAALCTQVQAQWHNLSLKSFGFSPKVQSTPTTSSHETVSITLSRSHSITWCTVLAATSRFMSCSIDTKSHKASGCMVAFSSGTSKYAAAERIVKPRQCMWHCGTVALWHCEWCDSLKFAQHS